MIAVDGKDGATGTPACTSAPPTPADRFATAAQLDPRPRTTSVDLSLTGAEPGEPAHAGRPAVRSTLAAVHARAARSSSRRARAPTTADTVLAAYTGGDVGSADARRVRRRRRRRAATADARRAAALHRRSAGVTYSIAVDASAPGIRQRRLQAAARQRRPRRRPRPGAQRPARVERHAARRHARGRRARARRRPHRRVGLVPRPGRDRAHGPPLRLPGELQPGQRRAPGGATPAARSRRCSRSPAPSRRRARTGLAGGRLAFTGATRQPTCSWPSPRRGRRTTTS